MVDSRKNETVLWYSRYAVWVGAIVLLVQAVTGRSVGLVSLIGILLLVFGFLVFLAAIAWQGIGPRLMVLEPAPQSSDTAASERIDEAVDLEPAAQPLLEPQAAAPTPESVVPAIVTEEAREAASPSAVEPPAAEIEEEQWSAVQSI